MGTLIKLVAKELDETGNCTLWWEERKVAEVRTIPKLDVFWLAREAERKFRNLHIDNYNKAIESVIKAALRKEQKKTEKPKEKIAAKKVGRISMRDMRKKKGK